VIGLALVLLVVALAAGSIAAHVGAYNRIAAIQQQLEIAERERARDRELLEAVLLEDPGKVRRLMGRA
jgi:hypothetical protein